MGPISLRPTDGLGWAKQRRPERLRATFNRRHGSRYVLGAYDVHADYLRSRMRPRRTGAEKLRFMRTIRSSYPRRTRLFWIQDNPTYASYLNRIECHFGPIQEFVFNNADYLDWDAASFALARHVRYRNPPHRNHRPAAAERKLLTAARR